MRNVINIIEDGKRYIKPEKENEWIEACESLTNKQHGLGEVGLKIIEDSVEFMFFLEEGEKTVDEILRTLDDGELSGLSWQLIKLIVLRFSSKADTLEENMINIKKQHTKKII